MTTDTQQQQFLEILRQNGGILHKVCRMYGNTEEDRQDLFQEMIAQLWKAYPGFRQEAKISTWIYRIALNTAIAGYRKQQRQVFTIAMNADMSIMNDADDLIKAERLKLMYSAIARLTDVEKALVMLYIEDKTYEEMEDILGMTQGNLRVKMNRIKEKLRKQVLEE
ncbi:MAG: sigma-70 family RNA polymerase sigma factor [Agriterribacter sp.]